MLQEGIIEPCDSSYTSPITLCGKKNGKPLKNPKVRDLRLTTVGSTLDEVDDVSSSCHAMIEKFFFIKHHTQFMTTLDLKNGYFQIPVRDCDI